MQEIWVPSLGEEDPLEKEMSIRSSILAWRILASSVLAVDRGTWQATVHGVTKESDMT